MFSLSTQDAAHWAIEGVNGVKEIKRLRDLALRETIEVVIDNDELNRAVVEEVKTNAALEGLRQKGPLNSLPGVKPDEMQVLSGVFDANQDTDIAQVLRVAQAFVESKAAVAGRADDVYTSSHVAHLYRGAIEQHTSASAYVSLREMANLPDVGELAIQNIDTRNYILKLRTSTAGSQFRKWFHEQCAKDPSAVTKEYTDLLKASPFLESTGGRIMRYLIQVGVGLAALPYNPWLGLSMGMTAGAIDSFLVPHITGGSTPKIFLERLEGLKSD
jgi:hypothetical protein